MPETILFATKDCPRCKLLSAKLKALGKSFEEKDMGDAETLASLRADWGYFGLEAPVLLVDTFLYAPSFLFKHDSLKDGLEHLL